MLLACRDMVVRQECGPMESQSKLRPCSLLSSCHVALFLGDLQPVV